MKLRMVNLAAIVFAVLLLLVPYSVAQIPQLTPFAADMQVNSKSGTEVTGKIYITPEHMRSEMQTQGFGGVVITTFATKTVDVLMPQQHMYMEMTGKDMPNRPGATPSLKPFRDPSNPCAYEEGATCKKIGTESVNGRSCDHWQITDKNGKVVNVWIDQKLHFPIKTVTGDTTIQLTNIQEGSQPASLFQIPAGYQKMDMSQMMQGMRPPQQ